jgi:succinate dehydrogenase/fumarate reductase cytochrome b subunit
VRHLSDDDLVLHYYGENGPDLGRVESHLKSCAQCAGAYESLARTLSAVTAPEPVEGADDLPDIRSFILDRMRDKTPTALIPLVWLVPLLHPLSSQALFNSARLAQEHVIGLLLVALTVTWTFAGPFVAVYALTRMAIDRFDRVSTRVLIFGALMATISPVLFVLISRVIPGLQWWYAAVALVSLLALMPWPISARPTAHLLLVHRLSAVVITIFALAHVANQVVAFVSVSSYNATMNVLRVGYHQPVVLGLIMAATAIQIATGSAMFMKKVRAGSLSANLQAVTGWYLALFLLTHVFGGLLLRLIGPVMTTGAAPVSEFDLLATPRSTAQLPFLLLGVATFLFHVGVYARLMAMAFLAEEGVRRLSYVALFAGTTVVVTVGLALCGVHLIR